MLLTNVMTYWLTGTAYSSARIYADEASTWGAEPPECKVPVCVAVAPRNITVPIRRVGERKNNIVRWTKLARGGHFTAMEVPELLLADLRDALRPLR